MIIIHLHQRDFYRNIEIFRRYHLTLNCDSSSSPMEVDPSWESCVSARFKISSMSIAWKVVKTGYLKIRILADKDMFQISNKNTILICSVLCWMFKVNKNGIIRSSLEVRMLQNSITTLIWHYRICILWIQSLFIKLKTAFGLHLLHIWQVTRDSHPLFF